MKAVLMTLAFAALAFAAPPVDDKEAQVVSEVFEPQPDGSYNFNFETNNGISRNEQGELKQALDEENKPHDVVVVRGSYAYTNPEGKPETISYYADETGFHAEGESIPKEPVARR